MMVKLASEEQRGAPFSAEMNGGVGLWGEHGGVVVLLLSPVRWARHVVHHVVLVRRREHLRLCERQSRRRTGRDIRH